MSQNHQRADETMHSPPHTPKSPHEPIAIVGIGCRFPGGASTPTAFWQLLRNGVDAIQEPPASRWNMERFYDAAEGKPGKSYSRWGGFIEDIDQFDAHFFGISPREASNMDPQHRLLLEVAWEAMEDAGQVPEQLPERNGVFIGISGHDYGDIQAAISERNSLNAYSILGSSLSIAANRISYTFNFKGPSMVVDTACSSSLVAVHLACQSIWNGESDAALAGGVNVILRPEGLIGFSKASMLSPDGRCKAFDASANGFVRAEGAGVVLLKPYRQAVADGDAIYATILSTVVNQDGRTNGITVPGDAAQEAMLRAAYAQAGVEPAHVHYVEAHGTGTAVGDPIEAGALGRVLSHNRPAAAPCVIGSVKSNVGHLEPASGMAGLIKAALVVNHGEIPANLHFETPNPNIPFDDLLLRVPQCLEAWPDDGMPRVAGVNSFGFGGTNAHIVLAHPPSAPDHASTHGANSAPSVTTIETNQETNREINRAAHLLPLSARSPEALGELAAAYRAHLHQHPADPLSDIGYSASLRRAHHTHRLALVGNSRESLIEHLDSFLAHSAPHSASHSIQQGAEQSAEQAKEEQELSHPGLSSGRPLPDAPQVAFVFSGMGPQWWAMGRQLLAQEPLFHAVVERCDRLLSQYADFSLLHELMADEEASRIQQTAIAQPAIFAIQVGLAALWRSWGIEPARIVGHSVGEVAAAHVAGVLSLEDAVQVIYQRSRLQATTEGQGKMLAVGLPAAEAERLMAEVVTNHADRVSVAAINSPHAVTLAGDATALAAMESALETQGTFARFLKVEVPYHSPAMDSIQPQLVAALADITPQPATIPLFSTVTGESVDGPELEGAYWGRNARNPVQFAKVIEQFCAAGIDLFLEIGPHPVLAASMHECLAHAGATECTVLPSLRRQQPEQATLLGTLGRLYTLGCPIDWQQLYPTGAANATDSPAHPPRFVRLPTYPWQRERYWFESEESHAERVGPATHPLLGQRVQSVHAVWGTLLDMQQHPYLRDHAIQRAPTFPAAAYVEMALAAAQEYVGDANPAGTAFSTHTVIENLEFQKPLFLGDDPTPVQLTFESGQNSFAIYSQNRAEQSWVHHADGHLRTAAPATIAAPESLDQIRARCPQAMDGPSCYQRFTQVGLDYGPAFQGIAELWCGDGEVLGALQIPAEVAGELSTYQLHPALLDAAFQAIIGLVQESRAIHLPVQVARLTVPRLTGPRGTAHLAPHETVWSHVRLVEQRPASITVDIRLLDAAGQLLATFEGFRCQAVGGTQQSETNQVDALLYQYGWEVNRPSQAWELAEEMRTPQQIATALGAEVEHESQLADRAHYYTELEPKWDALYTLYVANAFRELGWQPEIGQRFSASAFADALGIVANQRPLVTRILQLWADDGFLAPVPQSPGQSPQWEIRRIPQAGDPDQLWQATMKEHPLHLAEQLLMQRCGSNLAAVLSGAQDPLQLIFPDASLDMAEHLYQDSAHARYYNILVQKVMAQVTATLPTERTVRVLEIGAGTGGLTSYVLPQLPPNRTEYHFTDISPQFMGQAATKFSAYPFITYGTLNIEADPAAQGFEPGTFNIILASNVLHATQDLRQVLTTAKELLAPNGLLIVLEITRDLRANMLVWGLLDGWWRFSDRDVRPTHPIISWQRWQALLAETGFAESAILADRHVTDVPLQSIILAQRSADPQAVPALSSAETDTELLPPDQTAEPWLIFTDQGGLGQGGLGQPVAAQLHAQGKRPILVEQGDCYRVLGADRYQICPTARADWERLLNAAPAPAGVVYLWSLDLPVLDAEISDQIGQETDKEHSPGNLDLSSFGHDAVTKLVQALGQRADTTPPRLWIVTRGGQSVTDGASSMMVAPLWTLGRVIINEHPYLHCKLVDLSATRSPAEIRALVDELSNHDQEDEIALRGTTRYVHRLQRRKLAELTSAPAPQSQAQPFFLEVTTPGILDDLTFRAFHRRQPGPGEVEIQVQATALNFKDVAKAMGLLGEDTLDGTASAQAVGLECAGTISAVGEGVTAFQIGDEVIAFAPNSFSTHAYAHAHFVLPKPPHMHFEEAATILLVFVTAHYALHHLGRIQPGERILIHAAAGGVGLAAIQMAQSVGAEIFATAGSPHKRHFLQALGIPATHIMDSRSLDFADQIMETTKGQGVDLVLNSLAGDALEKSLSVLAPFGRFLELGKRDIQQNSKLGLRPFQQNLSFFAIDLDRLSLERPQRASALFQEIMPYFADGTYQPLPHRLFSITGVVDAFRYMAQAKHIGKVVVSLADPDVPVAPPTAQPEAQPNSQPNSQPEAPLNASRFRADGTYLLTGGLGGFGLAVAAWMVEEGARHLLLMGRSGVKNEHQREAIRTMEAAGATVHVVQADVTQAADVARVLRGIKEQVPLRGVIHAAMVLDDALLDNLTPDRFERVMAPKVLGAWHLHRQTQTMPLDHFVLFSSASAAVGNPGQGSYVAANAFLEALAHTRQHLGLPALAVSWGAIAGVGYVANNQEVTEHLRRVGFDVLPYQQALTLLGEFMDRDTVQIAVGQVDWQRWAAFSNAGIQPRFSQLIVADQHQQQGDAQGGFLQQLEQIAVAERRDYLQAHLRGQVARVLGINKPEQIELRQPFFDLGLDSLMAVELKNRLEKSLERSLSQMLLFNHPSLAELVEHLATEVLPPAIAFEEEKEEKEEGAPAAAGDKPTPERAPLDAQGESAPVAPTASSPTETGALEPGMTETDTPETGTPETGPVANGTATQSTDSDATRRNGAGSNPTIDLDAEVLLDPTIRFDAPTRHTQGEPRALFLTGATGFLGAYLLHELLQQTTASIYCLVRATSDARALERIRKNLMHYALWDETLAGRIIPVLGDLSQPRMGLSAARFEQLAERIDTIYHNGAWVNFIVSYTDLKATNVLGTQEVLRFAAQGHVKPMHFISSYSVFFSRERTQSELIGEADALSPAATLCDSGYVQSKWVSEKVVTLARERGLPVAIYRPGVLAGDSRSGIANATAFVNRMILGCVQLRSIPTENTLMDLCPVDYAGLAVVTLSQQPESIGQAFHLVNPDPRSWHDWVGWINQMGYPLQAIPYDQWQERLSRALAKYAGAEGVTSTENIPNALYPFIEALPTSKGDAARFSLAQVYLEGHAPRFDCTNALNALAKNGIHYPIVDANLLRRYFDYFTAQGALL